MEGLITIIQFIMDHADDDIHTNAVRAIINVGEEASCACLIVHVVNMDDEDDSASAARIATLGRYVTMQMKSNRNKRAKMSPSSPIRSPVYSPSSPGY